MKYFRKKWLGIAMAGSLVIGAYGAARAVDLGDAIKLFGVGFAVKQFANPINKFLNSVLAKHNAAIADATKVVPIVSIGEGGYIGAAQVMGPRSLLSKVKAVGQGELNVGAVNGRLKGLFPIDTTNPLKGLHRVDGVGVSAIIDLKI
jgi:hypothetical protein